MKLIRCFSVSAVCALCICVSLQAIDANNDEKITVDMGTNNTFTVNNNINFFVIPSSQASLEQETTDEINLNDYTFIPTRKPGRKQLVLAGLAQACSDLGEIVGAANKQEKQQGYLNLIGTIIGVTAGLTQASPAQGQPTATQKPAVQPQSPAPQTQTTTQDNKENKQITRSLMQLINVLAKAESQEPAIQSRAQTLLIDQIKTLTTTKEKNDWFAQVFGNKQLTNQLLQEIFSLFYTFLCSKIPFLASMSSSTTDTMSATTTQTQQGLRNQTDAKVEENHG